MDGGINERSAALPERSWKMLYVWERPFQGVDDLREDIVVNVEVEQVLRGRVQGMRGVSEPEAAGFHLPSLAQFPEPCDEGTGRLVVETAWWEWHVAVAPESELVAVVEDVVVPLGIQCI